MGEPNRAGNHQFRQEHIVVFRKVGVHAPEGVIPFGVAARDFVNVHVGIKMFLPPGQDPVGPEQVGDAVLATAEDAGVTAQSHRKVMADGVGAAHKAAFVDEALQFVPRLVHLFQFIGHAQNLPGRVEHFRAALLPPDFHLPHVPLVRVAGGVDLQFRQEGVEQHGDAVVGKDQPFQLVSVRLPGDPDGEIFQLLFRMELVVHGVDRADAPHVSFCLLQKLRAVHHVPGPFRFGLIRVLFRPALPVKQKADMGQHFFVGQLAVHVVDMLFAFFRFLQEPLRVRAVVRNGINAIRWVHNVSSFVT